MCGTPHEYLPTPEPSCRRGGRRASRVARPAQNIRISWRHQPFAGPTEPIRTAGGRAFSPASCVTPRGGEMVAWTF
jgi:hypothetical protein